MSVCVYLRGGRERESVIVCVCVCVCVYVVAVVVEVVVVVCVSVCVCACVCRVCVWGGVGVCELSYMNVNFVHSVIIHCNWLS